MNGELSKLRLHAMRAIYLLTGVFLGYSTWSAMITRTKPWDPMHGVAFSFWCAYSLLMLIGVRFPVRMLPLLLLQLFYKTVWLLGVAYPLWASGLLTPGTAEMVQTFVIAVAVDLVVIPWPYVFTQFIRARYAGGAVQ